MKKKNKKITGVVGVISLIIGVTGAIPSFLNVNYFGLSASAFFVILGVILIAIGFGD